MSLWTEISPVSNAAAADDDGVDENMILLLLLLMMIWRVDDSDDGVDVDQWVFFILRKERRSITIEQ